MKSERPVRSSTGPARQFPGTVSRCSPPWANPRKRLPAKEREGLSVNPSPSDPEGQGARRSANRPLLLSPPKDRLPASSVWLLSGSGLRPAKRSTERPLNQRRQDMAENARASFRAADGSPRLPLRRASSDSGHAPRFGHGSSISGIHFSNGCADEKKEDEYPSLARATPLFPTIVWRGNRRLSPFSGTLHGAKKSSYHEIS